MKLLIVASCITLQGCLFYAQTSGSDPTASANTCVSENKVGAKMTNKETGKVGTIKAVYGRHQRCQEASHPFLATVEYE